MIKHNSNNPSKLRVLSEDELLAVVGGDGSSGVTGSDSSDPSSNSATDIGPDNVQKKHVSNIKWTPGKADVGSGGGS